MEVVHDFGEVGFGKVFGAETSVEGGQAEVDGVGPSGNRGFEALPVASGGEEFGFVWGGHPRG
jgi:hypothetical protein